MSSKLRFLICIAFAAGFSCPSSAQTINAAYVRRLYKQYPTRKSDFCPGCKVWVNPYFESIADTARHVPLLTFYVYTKAHRLMQEALHLRRSGQLASWHAVYRQKSESRVYAAANKEIGRPHSSFMIARGHCQAWILLAWNPDAAILSDTYTFNAAMEYQGQNTGTEEATENLCRELTGWKSAAITDSIKIWCGTYGEQQKYVKGAVTDAVPAYYFKILQYNDRQKNKKVTLCYWMPNKPEERRDSLGLRSISLAGLVRHLGFNPMKIFD
jgi:hypothetical protein